MPDWFWNVAPTIIGGVILAFVCWIASKTWLQLIKLKSEHKDLVEMKEEFDSWENNLKILMDSQRNQLKADIVRIYEMAKSRGDKITYMELDTLNRLADSYFALGGNHYIHTIVAKANKMELFGEVIPMAV